MSTSLGSHLSIFSKGLLLIAAPVVFQLVLLYAVHDVQTAAREAQTWARHSREVLTTTDEIARLIVQLVAIERGAVLTGNPQFDIASRPAAGEIVQQIDDLRHLVADSPVQAGRVDAIRRAAMSLEEWIGGEQDMLIAGRAIEAAERVRSGEGVTRTRRVQAAIAPFLAEETQLGDQREATLMAADARERQVTVVGAIVSLLLALMLVYVFTRSIAGRLGIVADNAQRLAAGAAMQPPVAGTDEIAQLDRVLHQTAARLAETAAAAERARLEVERRNEELARVNLELAQKTQENELFIYSVSHDLRSPLVNLQGFSKELTRACADLGQLLRGEGIAPDVRTAVTALTDQEIPESVHFIKTAVTRASLIIDALLRLSRAGRVEYRWQLVPVRTVVSNILDAMRAAINERKAELIVHPLADAWGDPVAVEQVFANLIGNAVNYLDPTRPGRIEIGMVEPTASADPGGTLAHTYFVKDNGLGIPASGLDKVFIAFQRLHAGAARGEGVGLALVRRIVDRHHGEIWVESTEGTGSTFFVRLPSSDTRTRTRTQPRTGDMTVVADSVNIIVVEDDDGHATLIERNLRRAGLSNPVLRLRDGQEALDYFFDGGRQASEADSVLLLDINMPRVDGIELLRRLKSDARTAKIPTIMLTTTDDPREIERCYQLGCNVYITKPVEYDAFMEAIRRLGFFLQIVRIASNHRTPGPA